MNWVCAKLYISVDFVEGMGNCYGMVRVAKGAVSRVRDPFDWWTRVTLRKTRASGDPFRRWARVTLRKAYASVHNLPQKIEVSKIMIVLFLVMLGTGCKFPNTPTKTYADTDSTKNIKFLDTVVGGQKVKVYSDSQKLYVFISDERKLWIDTIHYPISKDYDNLTKNICVDGSRLCNCYVQQKMLFFSFTDFSMIKMLVAVNLSNHNIVCFSDGQNIFGTYLKAFVFVGNKIICCHYPNLDGQDIALSEYTFTPDSLSYVKSRKVKISPMKLFDSDSTMKSFMKATYIQVNKAAKK